MRRRVGYIALSAALIAVVGGLAVAQAATDILATAIAVPVAIHNSGKAVVVNLGDNTKGPGDGVLLSYTLFDETDTTQVGTGHSQCTLQPGKEWQFCTVEVFLDTTITDPGGPITVRGQIMIEGAIHGTGASFDLPITGGTGYFANVRGYVHVERKTRTTATWTLNLLP